MRLRVLAAAPLLLAAATASADCDHTAPHRLTADLKGATSVAVIGRAGSLRVIGGPGGGVTATGTACASDRDFLAEMRIAARRDGPELVIEAIVPGRTVLFGWHDAKLDLEVTVPQNIPIRIKDGSGSIEVRDVAQLEVVDGSGELDIRGVRGNVEVTDGSGSLSIRDVAGDVRVEDGSGGIEVEGVRGSVRIVEDGSGSIDVDEVRGNFTVERDGSGGVQWDRVSGTVRVPKDR
ncbi:MAG: DUF4097 family beta strand repeat-containing protein [Thermoanaerobaculia bacterium]